MKVPKGTKLDHYKRCSCGKLYGDLPVDGVLNSLGVWFDCPAVSAVTGKVCGSSNLVVENPFRNYAGAKKHGKAK